MKEKFQKYLDLLNKWQKKINIVSDSTLENAYERHIKDSLELENFLPNKDAIIYDLGAGGGFPGLPLAISGYKNISLIESDSRKCAFMQQVKIAYKLPVTILNERIEKISGDADIITCRAFSDVLNIFILSKNLRNKDTKYVLIKGENYLSEIKKASTKYSFEYEVFPSSVFEGVNILIIKNVHLHV